MSFGSNLRNLRKSKGLTQAEIAQKLDVSQSIVAAYERGAKKPEMDKVPLIAQALGVPLDALYGISGKDGPAEKKGPGTRRESQIQKIFRELPPAKQRTVIEHAKWLKKGK